MESATIAIEPVGSIARLTGGPTTEFLSCRFVTIFGASGFARSTIRMESLPAGDRTGFPASSHTIFSSFPTIMNGAACVCAAWHSAQTKANNQSFLDDMNVLPLRYRIPVYLRDEALSLRGNPPMSRCPLLMLWTAPAPRHRSGIG